MLNTDKGTCLCPVTAGGVCWLDAMRKSREDLCICDSDRSVEHLSPGDAASKRKSFASRRLEVRNAIQTPIRRFEVWGWERGPCLTAEEKEESGTKSPSSGRGRASGGGTMTSV
jgi:hypothetical protein